MKATVLFSGLLMPYKVVLTFECYHSNETYQEILYAVFFIMLHNASLVILRKVGEIQNYRAVFN